MIDPPFKIPGGKRKLAAGIIQFMPDIIRAYTEPFAGGAAVFLALRSAGRFAADATITLNDLCPATAQVWQSLRDDVAQVGAVFESAREAYLAGDGEHQAWYYYLMRDLWNSGVTSAGLVLFLRATGYNGLWRMSKAGKLNTPWGKYKTFKLPDFEALHQALQGVSVFNQSYRDTLDLLGDEPHVVYVDPPYDAGFTAYTKEGFSDADQLDLIERCSTLAGMGHRVIYSNAATDRILGMLSAGWPRAEIHYVTAKRTIACKATSRGDAREVLVVGGPI